MALFLNAPCILPGRRMYHCILPAQICRFGLFRLHLIPLLKQLYIALKKPLRMAEERQSIGMPTGPSAVKTVRPCMSMWRWRGVGIAPVRSAA